MDLQSELKAKAAAAAVDYVKEDEYLGVGTGTTVGFFIAALALSGKRVKGCIPSSNATAQQLLAFGVPVCELNDIPSRIPVYVDGCDEIDHNFNMIKGGGGALTGEKVIAQESDEFVCIADESKLVNKLGAFPLPIEVLPKAVSSVTHALEKMGGKVTVRDFKTDNANKIIDVTGLNF
ncbi:MAG: ribose-5-phosphate isomerase RpiA, partial [Burkholderiales bacterium]|nr:ribose-5-phosphate isomerase RpiA [Burkholderiales bacterium]